MSLKTANTFPTSTTLKNVNDYQGGLKKLGSRHQGQTHSAPMDRVDVTVLRTETDPH